jgi:hypothetical protein
VRLLLLLLKVQGNSCAYDKSKDFLFDVLDANRLRRNFADPPQHIKDSISESDRFLFGGVWQRVDGHHRNHSKDGVELPFSLQEGEIWRTEETWCVLKSIPLMNNIIGLSFWLHG